MSRNNGILFSGALISELLNKSSASCSFANLDFFFSHPAHSDYIIILPFFVLKIFESKFSTKTNSIN